MKIGDRVRYIKAAFNIPYGVITNINRTYDVVHVDFGFTIIIAKSSELELIDTKFHEKQSNELTKREQFAMVAMQAYVNNYYSDKSIEHCAKTAIKMADELLKQLEE